jgi:hypothetical protein
VIRYNDQIKEDEMGGSWGTNVGEQKYLTGSYWGNLREKRPLGG